MASLENSAPAAVAQPFDDERGRLSEELALDAEKARKRGDIAASIVLFTQAAELEESAARDVPLTSPRVRCVLATSAASLWLKAGKRGDAERVASEFGVEI